VARYVLPLLPAVALIGGYTVAHLPALMGARRGRRARAGVAALLVAAGLGQTWWYGSGRARYEPDLSPRGLVELLQRDAGFDSSRLGTLEFDAPSIEFYLGHGIEQWGGRRGRAVDELRERVGSAGSPYLLLVREQTPAVIKKYGRAEEELAAAGVVVVERRAVGRVYSRPPGRTPIEVWLVRTRDSD